MRYARDQKARTRQRILGEASRVVRAEGTAHLSIDDLMERLGLTHGAFYGHFPSREAVLAEACAQDFTPEEAALIVGAADGMEAAPLGTLITHYLSPEHRDTPGMGCYLPAIAGEIARGTPAARANYTRAFRRAAGHLAGRIAAAAHEADVADEDAALALLTGMAGAVMIARAVDDPALSDRVLSAARNFYARALGADLPDEHVDAAEQPGDTDELKRTGTGE